MKHSQIRDFISIRHWSDDNEIVRKPYKFDKPGKIII